MGRSRQDNERRGARRLVTCLGLFLALLTVPVAARSGLALMLWYVTTRRARIIVVMNLPVGWFLALIDGVECGYFRHNNSPLFD